jgi:hypothetical protein
VARAIHLGGHSRYVLALAVESLDRADRLLASFPPLALSECTAEMRRISREQIAALEAGARELVVRALPAAGGRLTWSPPADGADVRRVIRPWEIELAL